MSIKIISMNEFIKQQQELARNKAEHVHEVSKSYEFTRETLDTLITQIITNTGEELKRLVEGERRKLTHDNGCSIINPETASHCDCSFASEDVLVDTIKQHITKLTGVE